jgi:hypothetical protein
MGASFSATAGDCGAQEVMMPENGEKGDRKR